MKQKEYAVIDIGSNSLRLMRGWQDAQGSWHLGAKVLETTRLRRDLDRTGRLSIDGMETSFKVMARWYSSLEGISVCAVATSAVREAVDGQAFLAEIRARFGWHCRVISGLEEAALSFCGAASTAEAGQHIVVLDIGGGSSEVAAGVDGIIQWAHSYPLGAVRLTSNAVMTDQEILALEAHCTSQWLPMHTLPDKVIGVGGTLTTLAAMQLDMETYDPRRVDGSVISFENLIRHIERLQRMTVEERRHVPGLQPGRSDIIVAGLVIARSFMRTYGFSEITVSEQDLMEGLFFRDSFHDAAWRSTDSKQEGVL